MKKYNLMAVLVLLSTGLAWSADNMTMQENKSMMSNEKTTMHKEHKHAYVTMKDGKMMEMEGGKLMPMDKDMTMKNGTMVMKDGTVMMKDGSKMMMKDGEKMDMSGKMMPAHMMKKSMGTEPMKKPMETDTMKK